MKTIIALLAVALLAGCSTYSDVRARAANYSAVTSKTPQAFADCLLPKVMETNAASHILNNGAARTVVVPVGGGTPSAVAMVFDATPVNGATRVEMRHMPALNGFAKQWGQAEACL